MPFEPYDGPAGDHDQPYIFGDYPWLRFRSIDHARLMIMRSHIQDTREGFGTCYDGDLAAGPLLLEEYFDGLRPAA